jgi:hypothetical protein
LITLFSGAVATAQIPNGGFENWTDMGDYLEPNGWVTFNALTSSFGAGLSCEQVAPGAVGSYAIKVTTLELPGLGMVPGIALVGEADGSSTGFPYGARPAMFSGKWKGSIADGDQGVIVAFLTRWDPEAGEQVNVGVAQLMASGTVAGWTDFNIPFVYTDAGFPDTANVVVAASFDTGVAGSTIYADNLAFSTATQVQDQQQGADLVVFPQPARDAITIVNAGMMEEAAVFGMDGRMVIMQRVNDRRASIDVSGLRSGVYTVQLRMAGGGIMRRTFIRE